MEEVQMQYIDDVVVEFFGRVMVAAI